MFRKIIIKIKIKMAISYSYPMGTPKLTDTLLGVQYEEMKDPAVKNFSINDIVNLAVDEVGIPTLQDVTGEGANTTVQMQINGVDVATLDDIPATPTLQQVLDQGNTAVAGAFNTLTLTGSAVSILNPSTFAGTTLRRDSLRFTVYDFLEEITVRMDLAVPALTENRSIQLPDADGVVALTTDIPTPAYKVYTALLTQTGTSAPAATVLENTLEGTIIWTYDSTGEYLGTLTGAFINNKTYFSGLADQGTQLKVLRFNNDVVNVGTAILGVKTNGALNLTPIEIRVYN